MTSTTLEDQILAAVAASPLPMSCHDLTVAISRGAISIRGRLRKLELGGRLVSEVSRRGRGRGKVAKRYRIPKEG